MDIVAVSVGMLTALAPGDIDVLARDLNALSDQGGQMFSPPLR